MRIADVFDSSRAGATTVRARMTVNGRICDPNWSLSTGRSSVRQISDILSGTAAVINIQLVSTIGPLKKEMPWQSAAPSQGVKKSQQPW